jgi:DNA topoisomerase-1
MPWQNEPAAPACDKCGKPLIVKWSKRGTYLACTGYPDCTHTRELAADLPDTAGSDVAEPGNEEYCQNCGKRMLLKKGRLGAFFACTGYPDCNTTRQMSGGQKNSK